jgi:hypothetical protein
VAPACIRVDVGETARATPAGSQVDPGSAGGGTLMPQLGTNGYWWVVLAVIAGCLIIALTRRYRGRRRD